MKAQADMVYLVAVLFVVVLAVFVVDKVWMGLEGSPQFTTLSNSTSVGSHGVKSANTAIAIINNAIVLVFIGSAIGSILAAAFTETSIIFAVPALVILPIEILFSMIFHDAFFTIMDSSFLSGVITAYGTNIVTLFQYLPSVCLVLAVIEIAVLFIK